MSAAMPKAKPQLSREDIEKILKANKIDLDKHPVNLIGIRGYFLDSMGLKGANDRKVFDDALFWITPNLFAGFNANVDPNGVRKGKGYGKGKGMANLKVGVWQYQAGLHKGYQAFIQAGKVTVIRDGVNGDYEETGYFGINIHRAGMVSTSSLGCQTLPVAQWDTFKPCGYGELTRNKQKVFNYILLEETARRRGELKVS